MELYILQAMMGALMFGIGAMMFKWNAHYHGDDNYFFSALYSVGGICFIINGYDGYTPLSLSYYISGALIGLGSAGGNYFFVQGLRHGPAGLTSAFAKSNIVIVILISALYYGEALAVNEIIGIAAILVAMIVVNLRLGSGGKSTSTVWFILMIASMILIAFRNGGLKIVNEISLTSSLVMALAYFLCTIFFSAGMLKNKNKPWVSNASKLKVLSMGGLTGVASFTGLSYYIKALETGPASVVVTIFSLDMIFVLIMSYILFKERLNRNQMIGFILSAAGFLLISLK